MVSGGTVAIMNISWAWTYLPRIPARDPGMTAWACTRHLRRPGCRFLSIPFPRLCLRDGPQSTYPQANPDHTRVGFSQFSLCTAVRTYSIGRLGESLFRCGGSDILNDPCALGALVTLDPCRDLLCIDRSERLTPDIATKGRIVARSERLMVCLPIGCSAS